MKLSVRNAVLAGWLLSFVGCQSAPAPAATGHPGPETIGATVSRLTAEATALPPLLKTRWAVEYVASVAQLVPMSPRRLYASPDRRVYQSELEVRVQKQAPSATVQEWVDEAGYYTGSLGSPLFHARLIDLIAEGQLAKLAGKRSLELYPTAIGPLRLLAGAGLDAVGVSPSPKLRALYSQPGDQGPVKLPGRDVSGRVSFITGSFPADPAVRALVGSGFEFVLAKNVLKRGYIHPTGEVAPDSLLNLGMSEADYLRSLRDTLRPGGRLLVYNLCPGPNPAFYDPESDCRSPWSRADWQAAGFVVRDFERNDTEIARQYAVALGFDKPPISVPIDNLYAIYSLLERP